MYNNDLLDVVVPVHVVWCYKDSEVKRAADAWSRHSDTERKKYMNKS